MPFEVPKISVIIYGIFLSWSFRFSCVVGGLWGVEAHLRGHRRHWKPWICWPLGQLGHVAQGDMGFSNPEPQRSGFCFRPLNPKPNIRKFPQSDPSRLLSKSGSTPHAWRNKSTTIRSPKPQAFPSPESPKPWNTKLLERKPQTFKLKTPSAWTGRRSRLRGIGRVQSGCFDLRNQQPRWNRSSGAAQGFISSCLRICCLRTGVLQCFAGFW